MEKISYEKLHSLLSGTEGNSYIKCCLETTRGWGHLSEPMVKGHTGKGGKRKQICPNFRYRLHSLEGLSKWQNN